MNWFQRYGIPGAYFIGLTIAWVYTIYGKIPTLDCKVHGEILIGVMAIIFIPIGYIISITQQMLYLACPFLGIHSSAMNRKNRNKIYKKCKCCVEPKLEALSLIKTVQSENSMVAADHVRNWINKRMDIVAINSSLIVATIVSIAIAYIFQKIFCGKSYQTTDMEWKFIPSITFLVLTVLILSIILLRNQIIIVIAELNGKLKKNSWRQKFNKEIKITGGD